MMRAMDSTDLILSTQGVTPVDHERTPGSHGRALAICMAASMGLFCIGYDQAMASRIVSFDSFESSFCVGCSTSAPSADWDNFTYWFSTISTIGYILGAFVGCLFADHAGRKWAIMVGMLVFTLGTLWVTLSPQCAVMLSGRIFQGIGGGMYTFTLPIYCVEVATKEMRGSLAGFAQVVLGVGFFTGACVASKYADANWVLIYFVPLFPGVLLAIASIFLPESPRWVHLHKGKELAEIALKRIRDTWIVQRELDAIATQSSTVADIPGWKTLANKSIIKRIVIITALQIFQVIFALTVTVEFDSLTDIQEPAGFIPSIFGDFHFVLFAINIISALPALYILDAVGRYRLLIVGGIGMKLGHLIAGVSIHVGCDAEIYARTCTQGAADGVLVGTLVLLFSNMVCWVPVMWLYPAELFPTNVRAKATAISAVLSGASVFWVQELFPKLAEMAVISALLVVLALVIVHRRCHETKGLLLEDTEELFADGFPSKQHRNSVSAEVVVVDHPLRAA
ncbi:hypothetical protein Gpo141_00007030 [Globisporangium polare]